MLPRFLHNPESYSNRNLFRLVIRSESSVTTINLFLMDFLKGYIILYYVADKKVTCYDSFVML